MFIILVAPIVFNRIRIPGIVGLILFGTICGPSAIGLLNRDATMILLGMVGLIYLMFMVGLSIDLNQFNKMRLKSFTFGILSFGIPQTASIILAPLLLGYSLEAALLLGSIVGSHTLLAYPIANRLGITKNKAVTMTMGGTIITDGFSLMLLALVIAGAFAGRLEISFLFSFGIPVILFFLLVLLGIPRLGRWFFRTARMDGNTNYVFLVTILFITAYLAELVGLAAMIGAFLAGLSFNRLVPETSTMMNRVQFVGNALFIPFFLISVGLLVDVKALFSSFTVWFIAFFFTFLVVAGKFLAVLVSKGIFRLTKTELMTIFGLTIPQAASTLAVTLVGFDAGFFDQMAVNAVVIMILITCLAGPWLVEKYGRELAKEESKQPYRPSMAPQRILVPLANPLTADSLMDLAMFIQERGSNDPLYPLSVVREKADVGADVAASEKMLSHAVIHAAAAEKRVSPVTRVDLNIANGIIRAIRELRITHVIIGWNGEISTRDKIFGSILDQLLNETDQLTMVCKIDHPINTTKRVIILVPPFFQLEPGFSDALVTAQKIVQQSGAKAVLLATKDNSAAIQEIMTDREPKISPRLIEVDHLKNAVKEEIIEIKKDDLILLLSGREGSVSWQTYLKYFPQKLSTGFSTNNFIILYPSVVIDRSDAPISIAFSPEGDIPNLIAEDITFRLEAENFEKAIKNILTHPFRDDEQAFTRIANKLISTGPGNITSDLPGTILTYITTSFVEEPRIICGFSSNGFPHPVTGEKVHGIFVLLMPESSDLEANLHIIARMTRFIKHQNRYEVMWEINDEEALKTRFLGIKEDA